MEELGFINEQHIYYIMYLYTRTIIPEQLYVPHYFSTLIILIKVIQKFSFFFNPLLPETFSLSIFEI